MKISKGLLATIIIAAVIIIDQAIKIWVKTHFYLGEEVVIASWFRLLFIENNGMAFGMELGSKLFLTVFRLVLAGALIWYIWRIRHCAGAVKGYVVCLSLIVAGALGNIIDCVFYGEIFNNPFPPQIAEAFPPDGGYAQWFHGKVVDMFYFPLFSFVWPDWMPWVGGTVFEFFKPVFNFADASISVGIVTLIIFYHKYIASPEALAAVPDAEAEATSGHNEEK